MSAAPAPLAGVSGSLKKSQPHRLDHTTWSEAQREAAAAQRCRPGHGALRWLWAPSSAAPSLRAAAVAAGGHATLFRTSQAHGEADRAVGVFTPLSAVQAVELRLRDDAVTESDERERNQRSAPVVDAGLFLVPKVIE